MNFISKRTVALIDITAFKFILNKLTLEKVGTVYKEAITQAKDALRIDGVHNGTIQPCTSHVFSDSIIIYSLDDSESSCFTVIKFAQRIL